MAQLTVVIFRNIYQNLRMCLSTVALAKVEGPTPRVAAIKSARFRVRWGQVLNYGISDLIDQARHNSRPACPPSCHPKLYAKGEALREGGTPLVLRLAL